MLQCGQVTCDTDQTPWSHPVVSDSPNASTCLKMTSGSCLWRLLRKHASFTAWAREVTAVSHRSPLWLGSCGGRVWFLR